MRIFFSLVFCIVQGIVGYSAVEDGAGRNRSFFIDYDRNTFIKDGEPFRYVSGSVHYFRVLEDYWDDILRKSRLAGLNAISTYIEWSSHQPTPETKFDFKGNLNLTKFLDLAQKNDLLVILRPGPYIDSERDMGGLPAWLLWQKENMALRTSDLEYVYFVSKWFDHLLPMLKPYLYVNGGPIITVQVENEYGSYACDRNYTTFLRDLMRFHLGNDVVLFTTDGAGDSFLKCGWIPDVYPSVDFGTTNDAGVISAFKAQRDYAPTGPLINSEFYPGWIDHWQKPHSKVASLGVASTLDKMLSMGANVNIYVFHGGTSFGFKAGANIDDGQYDACPTSYDFDAPVTEAGDPTEKFFRIKRVIAKYMDVPKEDPVTTSKMAYGKVHLTRFANLFGSEFLVLFGQQPVHSLNPLNFEDMKIASGFVLYQTTVTFVTTDPVTLALPELRDRAYIYVDQQYMGVLSRFLNMTSKPLGIRKGQRLSILVENQGRVCYGREISENKGTGTQVYLGHDLLLNWTMINFGEFNGKLLTKYGFQANQSQVKESSSTSKVGRDKSQNRIERGGASFFTGNFTATTVNGTILDTFVDMSGFAKGIIWINGFNLGKYWPIVGPQQTLYLPAPLLRPAPAINTIALFELERSPEGCFDESLDSCFVTLTDTHVIDGPTPYKQVVGWDGVRKFSKRAGFK